MLQFCVDASHFLDGKEHEGDIRNKSGYATDRHIPKLSLNTPIPNDATERHSSDELHHGKE